MRTIFLLLPLLACGKPDRPVEPTLPADALAVSEALLPHCLYGLDPHARGVSSDRDGSPGYGLRLRSPDLRMYLGFRDGDRVVSVNGHALGGAEQGFVARKAVDGARACAWVVRRDGAERTLYARILPRVALQPGQVDRAEALASLIDPYAAQRKAGTGPAGLPGFLAAQGIGEGEAVVERNGTRIPGPHLLRRSLLMDLTGDAPTTLAVLNPNTGERRELVLTWVGALPPAPEIPAELEDDNPTPVLLDQTLNRAWFQAQLADTEALGRSGRAIPHRGPDGEVDGFRISGIRRGSLGAQLGLLNGDVVHALAGRPVTRVEQALEAHAVAKTQDVVTVDLTRRGKRLQLKYTLSDDAPPPAADPPAPAAPDEQAPDEPNAVDAP